MLEALLVSTVVLWIVVVALAAVVVALVRQVGVLHARVAPAGALVSRDEPRVGAPAPRLSLRDWSGRPLEVGGADGAGRTTLLLFVSPSCPVCKTLLPIVESLRRGARGRLRVVLASDGPVAEHEAFVAANGLAEREYALSAELGHAFQVGKLPWAALIDAAGVLRARGLVNTREHLESLFEALDRGVGTVQEYLAGRSPLVAPGSGDGGERRAPSDERPGTSGRAGGAPP